MAFRCTVSIDLFRRALSCVSTEETRYYLKGVQVEPSPEGGALLIATDARRMIVIHDPTGCVEGSAIVAPSKATVTALKGKSPRQLRVADGLLTVWGGFGDILERQHIQADIPLIDGTFPDWRRVVHDDFWTSERNVGPFNSALLKPLAEALSNDRAPFATLYATAPTNAILVMGSLRGAFGVLMPIRHSAPALTSLPAWAGERKAHVA